MRPRIVAASMVGDPARVAELARAGADLRAEDVSGYTCLMAAADCLHMSVMRELLSTAGVDGALVRARVAAGLHGEGHSAFTLACRMVFTHDALTRIAKLCRHVPCAVAPGHRGGGDESEDGRIGRSSANNDGREKLKRT